MTADHCKKCGRKCYKTADCRTDMSKVKWFFFHCKYGHMGAKCSKSYGKAPTKPEKGKEKVKEKDKEKFKEKVTKDKASRKVEKKRKVRCTNLLKLPLVIKEGEWSDDFCGGTGMVFGAVTIAEISSLGKALPLQHVKKSEERQQSSNPLENNKKVKKEKKRALMSLLINKVLGDGQDCKWWLVRPESQ